MILFYNNANILDRAMQDVPWQELTFKYRWQIAFVLIGLVLLGGGVVLLKGGFASNEEVKVLSEIDNQEGEVHEIVVEIAGGVKNPGVYRFSEGARIDDLINKSGGFFEENKEWVSKFINRAAKLVDGQKVYIPKHSEVESANNFGAGEGANHGLVGTYTGRVNINTASQGELESLWGIGPVYAQKIIDHRPYSSVDELISKGILKNNVYERNKDLLTVF